MKLMILLALQVFAEAKPAWEVSDRWNCQMELLRTCNAMGGDCATQPSSITYRLDFSAKTGGVFDPPSEQVIGRNFNAGLGAALRGSTKVSLDSGDTLIIATDPREGKSQDGKSFDAILTRMNTGEQRLFYGYCRPA